MKTKKRGVILAALIVFLLLVSLVAAIDGCYYYPKASSTLYCQKVAEDKASADYAIKGIAETTDYKSYFTAGKDCSGISTCKTITCNVNCQEMTQGECQKLAESKDKGKETGWQEVTDSTYNDWCTEGCCKVSNTCYYQQSGGTKWACQNIAIKNGLTAPTSWLTKIIDSSMNPTKCQQSCGIKVTQVTLQGTIHDQDKKPLAEVKLELNGKSQTTTSSGTYSFQSDPGTYLIKVSKTGYSTLNPAITIKANQTNELNFTLTKLIGTAQLSGYVKDKDGNPINRALISWKGKTSGSVLTDINGFYTAKGLVSNDQYIFTLSKYEYTTSDQSLTLKSTDEKKNFLLEKSKLQGIRGYVWIDKDGDGTKDEKIYGASIYINGVFKGYSQYSPMGYYEISLASGTQEISASYSEYDLKNKINLTLTSGETKNQDIVLTKFVGECSYGGNSSTKAVEKFSASPVLGEKKVLLGWTKPCPEVSAYQIVKYENGKKVNQFSASPATFSYLDNQVEWGKKYDYEITAVYTDVQTRFSTAVKVTITLGDKECENEYSSKTGWSNFCSIDSKERKSIWTCDSQNKKVKSKDCSVLDTTGSAYYCAEITSSTATCKDAGKCSLLSQSADPFGLYYNRQTCYGVKSTTISSGDPVNYCYFDYTKSIANTCDSCADVKSCFDYQSKDACSINNCLGTTCQWIPSAKGLNIYKGFENILSLPIAEETGHGYCAQKDYQKDDKCNLCSSTTPSTLFENYYCTSAVCSQLGKCFSYYDLTECKACGTKPDQNHNCYSYSTQDECTQGKPLTNQFGEITLSQDQCDWGRCVWKGQANKFDQQGCVKDGDGDGKEDCAQFTAGEKTLCEIDNQAPETKLVPEGKVKTVSTIDTNLTFQGVDNSSRMGVLGYCLASAKSNTPKCTTFQEINYPGKLSAESAIVDVVGIALKGKIIKGETYRLRYYSKDRYFNQENIKEEFIFVDTELPQFEIKYNSTTTIDKTDLTVYLSGVNEPMACSFNLDPLLPKSTLQTKSVARTEKNKISAFTGLTGIIYNLTVTCIDDYNNQKIANKQFVFDLEPTIDVIYPKGAIAKTTIPFQVKTATKATCSLFNDKNQKMADFVADAENKEHKTSTFSLIQGNYSGTYKAICKDLLTQKIKEDYFDFQIDLSAPQTTILLTEGDRLETISTSNWKESFVDSALVSSFKCSASGFSCNQTYYCLGSGCEYRGAAGYKEFTKSVQLNASTKICYYSVDTGGNQEYPLCGEVLIEGFGISLVSPTQHTYQGEKWGISNKPNFDWIISTKVPTSSCKFDFNSQFDYEKLEAYKTLKQDNTGGNYYFDDDSKIKFPGTTISAYSSKGGVKIVYVKCKDLGNKTGPVQKMNLEYDPTAPQISKAYAQPTKISEGTTVNLYAETDDKTLCKFNEGKAEYTSMKYSFPGVENKTLTTSHETKFTLSFSGAKKDYTLVVQCQNGAGNLSQTKNITFSVDYSTSGNIVSTSPSGYISGKDVTLAAVTNKKAVCKYNLTTFKTTDGLTHQSLMGTLKEGTYNYLVSCLVSGEKREGKIGFIVDTTPPKITKIDDGLYSCGLKDTANILVSTDEGNLSYYNYELYESTQSNGTTSTKKLVTNGTIAATSPFKLDISLTNNSKYYIKVKAGDKAGNWGSFVESDGFLAVESSYSECDKDQTPPVVKFNTNDTCTSILVEMSCTDSTSCKKFDYYESSVSTSCIPSLSYNGQKITLQKTGWVCYYAQDAKGNNVTETKKIEFKDTDGDGVTDSCDNCTGTVSGSYVDSQGCASGQTTATQKTTDTDGDGLPDSWERLYNDVSLNCSLNHLKQDSDGDGTTDDKEDYDLDKYTNYEEYTSYYDPCYADAPAKKITSTNVTSTITKTTPTSTTTATTSLVAWILLSLGILLILGGSGYLVYYYKFAQTPSRPTVRPTAARPVRPAISTRPTVSPLASWKQRVFGLRKVKVEKEKLKQRESLFGMFNQDSKKIPHLAPILNRNIPHQERVVQLANKYVEKKEIIQPGLKHGEKGIFAKLEGIANKTKDKPVQEVVSKGEAKSIFDKLKKISAERKK